MWYSDLGPKLKLCKTVQNCVAMQNLAKCIVLHNLSLGPKRETIKNMVLFLFWYRFVTVSQLKLCL